eukprot:TRINITY_DN5634_c0_g1_i1.p1 TRINITY_DN5634_c0_g1~~TRINITY_DN5634_c0_g1_i1.p1  ORF type:complete len:397 (+),score=142.62 TRINITY_DN5634_c0_g1_i1:74-1264(+)
MCIRDRAERDLAESKAEAVQMSEEAQKRAVAQLEQERAQIVAQIRAELEAEQESPVQNPEQQPEQDEPGDQADRVVELEKEALMKQIERARTARKEMARASANEKLLAGQKLNLVQQKHQELTRQATKAAEDAALNVKAAEEGSGILEEHRAGLRRKNSPQDSFNTFIEQERPASTLSTESSMQESFNTFMEHNKSDSEHETPSELAPCNDAPSPPASIDSVQWRILSDYEEALDKEALRAIADLDDSPAAYQFPGHYGQPPGSSSRPSVNRHVASILNSDARERDPLDKQFEEYLLTHPGGLHDPLDEAFEKHLKQDIGAQPSKQRAYLQEIVHMSPSSYTDMLKTKAAGSPVDPPGIQSSPAVEMPGSDRAKAIIDSVREDVTTVRQILLDALS